MTDHEDRHPTRWTLLNIALILLSAVPVLYPPARDIGAFQVLFGLLLVPTYFVCLLKRLKASGHGDATIAQLYRRAKAGQRLKHDALEWAAAVALALAVYKIALA